MGIEIIKFFIPDTDKSNKEYLVSYGGEYLRNSVYMPVAMLPF